MIRLSLVTLAGLGVTCVVAWRLGGTVGTGCLLGFLLGAGMCGLGVLHQRHVLLTQPSKSMQALAVSFLAKLIVLVSGALVFRFVEAAAARADWRSFLITFAAAVAIVLPLGTFDAARAFEKKLRTAEPPTGGIG